MPTPAVAARTLGDVIAHQCAVRPDAPAQVFEGVPTSYAQLNQYANSVANGLRGEGLAAQHRIAYLGRNSDVYFELLFGAARAGTVLIGLNWRLAAPEIAFILNDGEAQILFVEEMFRPVVDACLPQCPGIRKVIYTSGAAADYRGWRDAQSDVEPDITVAEDDVVMQMYTSGTTGWPKGVLISHRCFMAQMAAADAAADWGQWRDDDISLVAMPTFHIGGTMWAFTAFYQGCVNLLLPAAEMSAVLRAIETRRASRMFVVPALLQAMVNDDGARAADLGSMRVIIYGASPIAEDVLRRSMQLFANAIFTQHYGMTETAGSIAALPPADHDLQGSPRMKSCGKPFAGVDVKIVSPEGEVLPPGGVGEILIRTGSVMRGYFKRDAATAEALRDGWYHSGDAGYLDEDGYLYIEDRIKDMIVSGGENIYPAEIENALHGHPAVRDVAVIGVPDDRWGEVVKAVVVGQPGADLSEAELLAFARERIAGYKLPKSVDFVDELPRNASGKLLKHVLREPYWRGRARAVN